MLACAEPPSPSLLHRSSSPCRSPRAGATTTPPTPPASGGPAGSELVVHGKDTLKFDKDAYTAKAGTIDVRLVNDGSVNHTLLIKDVDDFELKVPGTDEGTVDLEAGTYTLYCDVAGHEAAGMEAELTVE